MYSVIVLELIVINCVPLHLSVDMCIHKKLTGQRTAERMNMSLRLRALPWTCSHQRLTSRLTDSEWLCKGKGRATCCSILAWVRLNCSSVLYCLVGASWLALAHESWCFFSLLQDYSVKSVVSPQYTAMKCVKSNELMSHNTTVQLADIPPPQLTTKCLRPLWHKLLIVPSLPHGGIARLSWP